MILSDKRKKPAQDGFSKRKLLEDIKEVTELMGGLRTHGKHKHSRGLGGRLHSHDSSIGWLWAAQFNQFSSVAQSCSTLCDPMNCSTPGLPVHHQLPEFTQTHVHQVSDAIQPSHPLLPPSPPAHNPFQHQSLFQWVNSSHEVAKVLEFQL